MSFEDCLWKKRMLSSSYCEFFWPSSPICMIHFSKALCVYSVTQTGSSPGPLSVMSSPQYWVQSVG